MKKLFKLSFSQNKQLEEFCEIMNITEEAVLKDFKQSLKTTLKPDNKKVNSAKLMDYLRKRRYPEHTEAVAHFNRISRTLSKSGIRLNFDPSFEKDKISINFNFSDKREFDQVLSFLNENKKEIEEALDFIRP